MSVLVKKGDRLRLEISNNDSPVADAPMSHWYGTPMSHWYGTPMSHWYGTKVGRDTYYHNQAQPSLLKLHERPR